MGSPDACRNKLLRSLPADVLQRWQPHMRAARLDLGQELRQPAAGVHFPTTALVSLIHVMADGSAAEVAIVGCDGVVGAPLLAGRPTSLHAVVQATGASCRLPAAFVMREVEQGGRVLALFLRAMQALLRQAAQTAACNRHHHIEQQLCRWLLMSLDRTGGSELRMTQELISQMLGVRREGIALAAADLQRRGIIRYARGRITVLDRPRLERSACECYVALKREKERGAARPRA